MEYSVGSLADLISGLNTPNKPKVVKKALKKNKQNNNVEEQITPKKRNKKKSVVESEIENGGTFTKKVKGGSKLKNEQNSGNNNVEEQITPKKRTKKKFVVETEIENGGKFTKKVKGGSKFKNEQNSGKRKRAASFAESIDEGASPPKKRKSSTPEENTNENKNEKNAEKRVKNKNKAENKVVNDSPEQLERTIFVGNVPIECAKKKIQKHFRKYGVIEAIWLRGVAAADLKTPKKVAAIRKEFNPNRSNVIYYVRFVEKEAAQKAEAEDGLLFEDHHLRVHACGSKQKPDETKAIFVGNLSFNAVEDDLWKLFEPCGAIAYVRIVRDSQTGMGKGFGYVNFKDADAVQLAIEMENVTLHDRQLRISLCNLNSARKNKNNNKKKKITQPGKQKIKNKLKKQSPKKADGSENDNKVVETNAEFQGTKFNDKNKKRKFNKGLLEKKKLVKKIAPKLK